MKPNFLRLDEDQVLVEQLRLVFVHMGSTVIAVSLLASLMLCTLFNDRNAIALSLWYVAIMSSVLYDYFYARRQLAAGIPSEKTQRIAWALFLQHAISGLLWGSLIWVTLDTSNVAVADNILVMAVIAGMAGGAISTLSPVLPLVAAFIIPELGVVAFKMWQLSDPAYNVLSLACVIYALSLLDHACSSARATQEAINLRFENVELIEKLLKQTEVAEQANIAKSRFLAAASHDLRQPIHAQGLFLDVLSRTNLTAEQHKLTVSLCAANEASAEMLNTLLDFSRIEAGVIEPQIQAFSLQSLLNKIEREFASQADAKGLTYRSRETSLIVESDPALLKLILRNLVSNAIRYTDHGGLLVAIRKRGCKAILEVRDSGIGIESSQYRNIFREFHQLGNPERDRRKGLGLGLAIVSGLARVLQHDLSLASTLHRGSVFRLTLPIATIALPIISLDQKPEKTMPLNVRVLVIDDDEVVRNSMLHLLRDWGCECEAADSIEEAVTLAQLNLPDVVISDYRLREQRTGAEAVLALRVLANNSHLPALLITGDTAPDRIREAHASGIPLLHKPISPNLLYSRLATILSH